MELPRTDVCMDAVMAGHDEVQAAADDLSQWWARCSGAMSPPFPELSRRLHELREMLRQHFGAEVCAEEAARLTAMGIRPNERALLLAELDQLIARLRSCHPGMDCWADAENALNRFLTKLSFHEQQEQETLRAAPKVIPPRG